MTNAAMEVTNAAMEVTNAAMDATNTTMEVTDVDAQDPHRSGIVVGFDASSSGRHALAWAAAEARLRDCQLMVAHVDYWVPLALELPAFEEEDAIDQGMVEEGVHWVAEHHPSVAVTGRRLSPPAGESLVAASRDASLLVVGSRWLGEVHQLVLGSVSRYCVEHATCPVVVVR